MSDENEVVGTESTVESAPSTPEVTAPVEASPEKGAADRAPEIPAYSPNYKFKANQRELEFDEFVRPAIKSPEVEKKIRELYEKAHGLDTIKPERDQLKQKYSDVQTEYGNVQKGISTLNHFIQNKDYESFFQALGVPKADIMQYALLQLKLQEASPEQRAAYEQQRMTTQQAYQLQQENQYLQSSLQQQSVSVRTNELDGALQKPEVSSAMQSFDQRSGRIGAFRDEVIRRGQLYAYQGQDIPVEQAVREVLYMIGQTQSNQPAPVVAPGAPGGKKPVIPNIQGRGTSPAKKIAKSLDDLKAYAKLKINEEQSNIG